MVERPLRGDLFPGFDAVTAFNPCYCFDSVGGRYVALVFIGSAGVPAMQQVVKAYQALGAPFDDERACVFIVTTDPEDIRTGRLGDRVPGLRILHDFDRAISRLAGVLDGDSLWAGTILLDPIHRVLAVVPVRNPATHAAEVAAMIAAQPPIPGIGITAAAAPPPILIAPDIFEPELCRALIADYDRTGGTDSGLMREAGGRTSGQLDYGFKRRFDAIIDDEALTTAVRVRFNRRLGPMIERAFQFRPTRIERYMVACYDSAVGGYFLPHKDNTTTATAHRRFAVSVQLNTEDYTGGEVRFPEFGGQSYRGSTGGAVVFSVSLLHEVTPVTSGRRLIFLTFLYDEAGHEIRERNGDCPPG